MTAELCSALHAYLYAVAADRSCRPSCSPAAAPAFCSGSTSPGSGPRRAPTARTTRATAWPTRAMSRLILSCARRARIPIVAAVNGAAAGFGGPGARAGQRHPLRPRPRRSSLAFPQRRRFRTATWASAAAAPPHRRVPVARDDAHRPVSSREEALGTASCADVVDAATVGPALRGRAADRRVSPWGILLTKQGFGPRSRSPPRQARSSTRTASRFIAPRPGASRGDRRVPREAGPGELRRLSREWGGETDLGRRPALVDELYVVGRPRAVSARHVCRTAPEAMILAISSPILWLRSGLDITWAPHPAPTTSRV